MSGRGGCTARQRFYESDFEKKKNERRITMKSMKIITAVAFVALMMAMVVPQPALAEGTQAGVTISNTADVDYSVGGIGQATVPSPAVTFLVDRKVDLTVSLTEVAAVPALPGSSGNVLRFNVKNASNSTLDFNLQAVAASTPAFGGTDTIDSNPTPPPAYADSNGNGTYEPAIDTATAINDLANAGSVAVFVVAAFDLTGVDGDIAAYDLLATAADAATGTTLSGTDNSGDVYDPNTVQTLYADGQGPADLDNDRQHSATGDYLLTTADLAVTKSFVVVDDGVPTTSPPNEMAIPGATVRYTILVANNGSAPANTVVVTDTVPTNTTYAGNVSAGGSEAAGVVTMPVASPLAAATSDTVGYDVTID